MASVFDLGAAENTGGASIGLTVSFPAQALVCLAVYEDNSSVSTTGSVADNAAVGNAYSVAVQQATGGGVLALFYLWNAKAVANATLTYTKNGNNRTAIAALYATGIVSEFNPLDAGFANSASGNGNSPSVTSGIPQTPNELVVACASMASLGSFTFAQDSANAAYAVPPDYEEGSAGGHNFAVAGGWVINPSGSLKYAPTLTGNPTWADIICGFQTINQPNTVLGLASSEW